MKKQKELALIKSEDEIAQAEAQIVELSKRIEFYLTEYSVELLASKMSKGEFVVPAYPNTRGSLIANPDSSNL